MYLQDAPAAQINVQCGTKPFFKICKIVFLGKSLTVDGGQNPLEPARFGCKIIHGPNIENFKEVYELLSFYFYERYNPDGSENGLIIEETGEEIFIKDALELWGLIIKVQPDIFDGKIR